MDIKHRQPNKQKGQNRKKKRETETIEQQLRYDTYINVEC